ncbi:MAG: D-glycerate dehydrogenase [Proteobacteria bacterium]|nr:D-glycerate dehydrogenase [Pseudomonadota bacterium]
MKPKVYITRKIPEQGIKLIAEFCDIFIQPGGEPPDEKEIIRNVGNKDAILCLLSDRINKNIINAAPVLKVISTMSAGFEHIDVSEATNQGIYIGYTPGVLTDATADLAFTLLLSVSRRIVEADRFVREINWKIAWSPELLLGQSVRGCTIGIIGLGRIGKGMAKRAQGFNMNVIYNSTTRLSSEEEKELGVEYRSLDDLLIESDFVSLHIPLTKETYHIIDEKRLGLMKTDAILINTSRGSVINEAALIKVLKENRIAGAGLDVFEKEPLDADNPLLKMNNVILLPHIGSANKKTRGKMSEIAADNLLAVLKGQQPLFWLNPEVEKIKSLTDMKMI